MTNQIAKIAENTLKISKSNKSILVPEIVADRYKVEDVLSSSTGFGLILIAKDMRLFERKVLIKASNYKNSIKKGNIDNEEIIKKRRKEIEYEFKILNIVRRINLPNVPVVRDFVYSYCPTILYQSDTCELNDLSLKNYAYDEPYIVLQYIPGITLDEYIEQNQIDRESPDWQMEVLSLVKQILKTLQKMHKIGEKNEKVQKLIYQDLKPSNILVTNQMNFALIDFGGTATVTNDGKILNRGVGTYGYIPPELAKSYLPFDERVDIYTVGVLMYELLTGINPILLANNDGVATLDYLKLNCHWKIAEIIKRATDHDVNRRYKNTEEMKNDIFQALVYLNEKTINYSIYEFFSKEDKNINCPNELIEDLSQNLFHEPHDNSGKLRIDVYVNKKLVDTKYFGYDEVTVGRSTPTEEVDLDLSAYDPQSNLSRKTLLIARRDGTYEVRDISRTGLGLYLNNKIMDKGKSYLLTPDSDNYVIIASPQPIGLILRVNSSKGGI